MAALVKRAIKTVAEAPSVILGQAIDISKQAIAVKPIAKSREYWDTLGPGLTTGASDDDPSGIATYSQTGAQYGFQLLWLAAFTFPLMAVVQEMCARIGLVTGQGLAGNIRDHFPRWVLYGCTILLLISNTLNIGADLGAMAKSVQLLWPQLNFGTLVLGFTFFSLAMQIFTPYDRYAKYLKFLALLLASYIFSALAIHLDWSQILINGIVPSITFSKDQIILICGILGTTISPYLFFWQTSQEVEHEILHGKQTLAARQGTDSKALKNMRVDVWSGMFVSNLVMFFIIVTCAAVLYSHGIKNINTAADAAAALGPIAGVNASLFFTLGIIGTGLLAVPVLAGAVSYALSESLEWKHGLHHELREANAFYGVIIISMFIGLAINFIGLDPIKALLYSAVVNGLVAPIILVLIVLLSSKKALMGEWVNSRITTFFGWFITGVMVIAGIGTVVSLFT